MLRLRFPTLSSLQSQATFGHSLEIPFEQVELNILQRLPLHRVSCQRTPTVRSQFGFQPGRSVLAESSAILLPVTKIADTCAERR